MRAQCKDSPYFLGGNTRQRTALEGQWLGDSTGSWAKVDLWIQLMELLAQAQTCLGGLSSLVISTPQVMTR